MSWTRSESCEVASLDIEKRSIFKPIDILSWTRVKLRLSIEKSREENIREIKDDEIEE